MTTIACLHTVRIGQHGGDLGGRRYRRSRPPAPGPAPRARLPSEPISWSNFCCSCTSNCCVRLLHAVAQLRRPLRDLLGRSHDVLCNMLGHGRRPLRRDSLWRSWLLRTWGRRFLPREAAGSSIGSSSIVLRPAGADCPPAGFRTRRLRRSSRLACPLEKILDLCAQRIGLLTASGFGRLRRLRLRLLLRLLHLAAARLAAVVPSAALL